MIYYTMRRYALLSSVRRYCTVITNQVALENPIKIPKEINAVNPRNVIINVDTDVDGDGDGDGDGDKIVWTEEQLRVIKAIKGGKSVFITGSAGTGKTKLLQHLIKHLEKIHGKGVYVTASTGVAACALKGQTLQSFAGVGLADSDQETLLSRVLSNKPALKRWKGAKALVIDEISMVDKELFEKYEYIAKRVRFVNGKCGRDEPWGGIQLVASGDFFQLPPVGNFDGFRFAFEAYCWRYSFQLQVPLKTIFRQTKLDHIRLLEGIRIGEIDSQGEELLKQRCCEEEPDETVMRLFPRVKDVDRVNRTRLMALGEEIVQYKASDYAVIDRLKNKLNHIIAPSNLELCNGARVMLIKNLNVKNNLVNGATGTIIGFKKSRVAAVGKICCHDDNKLLPIVKFDSGCEEAIKPCDWTVLEGGKVIAKRVQLPLILAWATSIHKSQGMTLDRLHTDLSEAFGCGMVYVVLSRLRSLDGLSLSGFNPSKIKAHPKVLEYYKKVFQINT